MNARDKETDLKYLKELQKELWPNLNGKGHVIKMQAVRPLKVKEAKTILNILDSWDFLTQMFTANMFGGYGISIYEHEPYPGTGPMHLLNITEFDLPASMNSKNGKPGTGIGSTDAWNLFSKYTHSEKNKVWLKMYKMEAPQHRSSYDY